MSKQSVTVNENGRNRLDIIQKGNDMIVRVPLRLTAAKLEVLKEVCKAQDMELPEFIQNILDDMVRAILEGSDVGKAINKRLLNIWQKEIGKDLNK